MNQNLPNLNIIKHIHLVGIGGAGMCGIAEVLINEGYRVTGSDLNENTVVKHLRDLGAKITIGHSKANIQNADVIVLSSAIPSDNPELLAAESANIPVLPRAKMLAALMQSKYGIAISGTHGKTTTTSLIASVLGEGGLDPTFVIGGLLKSIGTNAKLGGGKYFVAEADESDASFLYLRPKIAVVTNIDADHLSTYEHNMQCLRDSFLKFVNFVPSDGLVVLCSDDPIARDLLPEIKAPTISYGFNNNADIQVCDFEQKGLQSHFRVLNKLSLVEEEVILNLAGKHNALNSLAAMAVASKLKVTSDAVLAAFKKFLGIGRRFQMYGEFQIPAGKVLLIDDYGHHPREIEATLDAMRLVWPNRRLIMAYQPHRYTRTRDLMKDFVSVLSLPDLLFLLDVYPAGEPPIQGADGKSLCNAIKDKGKINPIFVPHIDELPKVVCEVLRDGDVLLIQGAGSIGNIAARMAKNFNLAI